jgi:hypothetical protein
MLLQTINTLNLNKNTTKPLTIIETNKTLNHKASFQTK